MTSDKLLNSSLKVPCVISLNKMIIKSPRALLHAPRLLFIYYLCPPCMLVSCLFSQLYNERLY